MLRGPRTWLSPEMGLPAQPRLWSGAASGFHKPGDGFTNKHTGAVLPENGPWAEAHFSRAEEARVWCKSRQSQVLSKARPVALLTWLGLHMKLQVRGGENWGQASWGAAWRHLRALGMGLRTHSGTNKGFLGVSLRAPAWNRHLFVSQDVLRVLEPWGEGLGASRGIRYPCSVPRS